MGEIGSYLEYYYYLGFIKNELFMFGFNGGI